MIPLQLEAVERGGQRTRGAALNQMLSMDTRRYVLSVDNDKMISHHDVTEHQLDTLGLQPMFCTCL